jgi:LCP family protein required for cell wall assembly
MDEMSKKENEILSEESTEVKPQKKKMSKKKKALVIVGCIVAFLLLLIVGALIAANIYVDSMLDLISYETEEVSWEGVDIDSPEYNTNYGGGEGIVSDPDSFVDPENPNNAGGNGGNGGGYGGGGFVAEQYHPDYTIIEGIFDDDIITDENDKDVVNILLIGADTLSGTGARSDTMILMSINHAKKRIVFSSLMRDTYVAIPGYNDNRLNAAFAAGGPNLLMRTIEYNFDIKIDHYFTVSIASFEMAVDVIGGVDITVNNVNYNYFNQYQKYKKYLEGMTKEEATNGSVMIHLSGGEALGFARSRNFYDGDFTRTQHQRDLLTQVLTSFKSLSLEEMHELLKAVLPYVATNMPKNTLKSMVWNVLTYVSYDISNARVPCPDGFQFANVRGMEVLLIDFRKNTEYLKAKIYS